MGTQNTVECDVEDGQRNENEGLDALSLPPRSVVRKQREEEKKRRKEERGTPAEKEHHETVGKVQFPLVRLFLLLFFMLVITVITYPVWIEYLR
ncbi:hypothetical protein [Alteribacter aurantiacus]|uniref:hypothetical protein n=1 Tax=Alteribacter aurantiacus TaxID=254410 RepID=UPI00041DD207|nr:hypothetical protein [Alteribacter aurantiacus]